MLRSSIKDQSIILALLLLVFAVFTGSNSQKEIIIGRWCLDSNDVNHPTLHFEEDSIAVFTSRGDTLYRYKYYVDGNRLMLINNKKLYETKITVLTANALHVESLPDARKPQKYFRCK